MIWLKIRHKYGNGVGSWDYLEIEKENKEENIEKAIRDFEYEVDDYWVERSLYDGAEYEIVNRPPKEWLSKRIQDFENVERDARYKIIQYENLIKQND